MHPPGQSRMARSRSHPNGALRYKGSYLRPVAIGTPERTTVRVGEIIQMDARMSYSPEGLPLTFSWRYSSGPIGTVFPVSGPVLSFYANTAGTYIVTLIVQDSQSSSRVNVAVTAAP